jgi:hypothetical protein
MADTTLSFDIPEPVLRMYEAASKRFKAGQGSPIGYLKIKEIEGWSTSKSFSKQIPSFGHVLAVSSPAGISAAGPGITGYGAPVFGGLWVACPPGPQTAELLLASLLPKEKALSEAVYSAIKGDQAQTIITLKNRIAVGYFQVGTGGDGEPLDLYQFFTAFIGIKSGAQDEKGNVGNFKEVNVDIGTMSKQ